MQLLQWGIAERQKKVNLKVSFQTLKLIVIFSTVPQLRPLHTKYILSKGHFGIHIFTQFTNINKQTRDTSETWMVDESLRDSSTNHDDCAAKLCRSCCQDFQSKLLVFHPGFVFVLFTVTRPMCKDLFMAAGLQPSVWLHLRQSYTSTDPWWFWHTFGSRKN